MKFWIFTFCIGLLALTSCTKSDDVTPQEEAISCENTAEATVQRMVLNEDGTEFFYYLEFGANLFRSASSLSQRFSSYLSKRGNESCAGICNYYSFARLYCLPGWTYY